MQSDGGKVLSEFIEYMETDYISDKKKIKYKVDENGYRTRFSTNIEQAGELSRALLNDFQGFKLIGGGFRFGTPIQGAKVKHLANMGRVISSESKPIPKPVEKYILSEADKYVKKELSKIKGSTFNIG